MPSHGRKVPLSCWFDGGNRATPDRFRQVSLARMPQITVLSRVARARRISEFLIVGCDHGWLGRIGYDLWGFELAAIRAASEAKGLFWYGFCSIYNSVPVRAGIGRSS